MALVCFSLSPSSAKSESRHQNTWNQNTKKQTLQAPPLSTSLPRPHAQPPIAGHFPPLMPRHLPTEASIDFEDPRLCSSPLPVARLLANSVEAISIRPGPSPPLRITAEVQCHPATPRSSLEAPRQAPSPQRLAEGMPLVTDMSLLDRRCLR
jgi:hypothetical protein